MATPLSREYRCLLYTVGAFLLSLSVVVRCGVFEDEEYCRPEQVHVAFGDTTTEMVIMWATAANCSTHVFYGTRLWDFSQSEPGEAKYFNHTNDYIRYYHRVKLQNLQPLTNYFYRPVSNNISTGPFYFEVPPSGEDWQPTLMVYGDLGSQADTIPLLTTEILKGTYTAVLHVGDFAYDLNDDDGYKKGNRTISDEEVGDVFMRLLEGITAHIPYMTSPGNHEINNDTFSHYRSRFSMPQSGWPIPLNKMWYSIDIGPVHFVSYSTEVFFTSNGDHVKEQHDWLHDDLQAANQNRDKRPWVIAFGHRPMYCSNSDTDDCTKSDSLVRAGLEDLFYDHGVDIVLQAHEHSYERLWPQYKGTVLAKNYINPLAPVQVVTGAAGSKEGPTPMDTVADEWAAFRLANKSFNSYGRLKVYNASHIFWEQICVLTGDILDSIWISQYFHGPFSQEKLSNDIKQKIDETKADMTSHDHDNVSTDQSSNRMAIDFSESRTRIALGASIGGLLLIIIVIVVASKKCRRKVTSYRRWDSLDYGRKFYSNVKDMEKDTDDDFEVDVTDGTLPTTKLLSSDALN